MNFLVQRLRGAVAATMVLMMLAGIFPPIHSAEAAVANTISFQGRLLSSPTTPAASTTYQMRFSIYSDADWESGTDFNVTTGALIGEAWSEVQTITTDSQGFFIAEVGSSTALPDFDSTTHKYLQAEVKADGAADSTYFLLDNMAYNNSVDRKSLMNSAYAQNSKQVDGRDVGLAAGNVPYLDANGKLDRSNLDLGTWLDPVADTTAMNAISSPDDGSIVYNQAEDSLYMYDGSSWSKIGGDLSAQLASLTTTVNTNTTNIATNTTNIATNTAEIGTTTYTEDNYVADTDTLAESIDKLDMALNDTDTNIGNQTYTEDNYVTDGETVTASLDALDQQAKDNADGIASNDTDIAANAAAIASNDTDIATNVTNIGNRTYTEDNFVTDGQSVTASIDVLDQEVQDNADAIAALDADTYSQSEVDGLISSAIQGLSWKDPVATEAALATTYTSPTTGDTAYVTGTGEIFTYNGSAWVKTGADFFQTATTEVEGIVELATDGEIAAGKVVQSNDSRLAQVATNTTNIATNAAAISSNDTDITNLQTADGNRTYTEDNYVTDGESLTASVDALDQQVKDNADSSAANATSITNLTNTVNTANGDKDYTEENYVTDNESFTDSIDALDVQVKDNEDDIDTLDNFVSQHFDVFLLP